MFEGGDTGRKLAPSGILVPLSTFALIGIICFLLFCTIRTLFSDVYAPRRSLSRCRPPSLPNSYFGWIYNVYSVKESFLVSTVGLDGVMLLRFFKMGIWLFSTLAFLGLFILVPVNYSAGGAKVHLPGGIWDEAKILQKLTVENVPQQSPYLKVHLAFTWIFSFIAYYYLITYYQQFVKLKLKYQQYLLKKSNFAKIDMRSVMVYGIPRELRDEVDLALYFESLNIGKVESVVICRRFTQLKRAVLMRGHYLCKLESLYAGLLNEERGQGRIRSYFSRLFSSFDRYESLVGSEPIEEYNPSVNEILYALQQANLSKPMTHRLGLFGLFGPRVNSLEFYSSEFNKWDRKVAQLRRNPETSPPTSVGFVTFESPESAAIASQINIASKPFMLMTKLAPEPRDLYWPNISSSTADPLVKLLRSISVYLCMFFMIFFSTLAVSAIASLIDLESLSRIIPGLKEIIEAMSPVVRQFIQGVIPSVVLSLWQSSLPLLLLTLSQFQGLEAVSWIEMSVLSKYFFYQLWNILLVVVSSTVFKSTAWPIQTPKDIIELLGNSLPQESATLMNYVMLQALSGYPAQLLLVGPWVLTWVTRLSPWSKGSPRQVSDAYYPSTLTSINYGIAYSVPMLLWVIGLTYAPIAPLILVFCVLFFAVGYMVLKYILLYVHIPQYESCGMHAPMAIRRLLVGMFIMQLTMMGVLALKSVPPRHSKVFINSANWSGYVSMVLAVSPLIIITTALFWWFRHGYEKEISHIPMDLLGQVGRNIKKFSQLGADGHFEKHQRVRNPSLREHSFVSASSSISNSPERKDRVDQPLRAPVDSHQEEQLLSFTNVIGEEGISEETGEILTDFEASLMHLEPPMTKVPGVLDAPLESSVPVIPEIEDHDFENGFATPKLGNFDLDLQLHTYLHPALIGRLPQAWLAGRIEQPASLMSAREEQSRHQIDVWRRVVGKQKLGMRNNTLYESSDEEEEELPYGPSPDIRTRGRRHRGRTLRHRISSFIDGLTSWAHLQMS